MEPSRGHVFLLIGPSGSGKTTLIREIRRRHPEITFIPSTTTRPPRPTETNGVEYFFVTEEEFDAILVRGGFLEWERIHGYRYGSSRERLTDAVARGVIGITSIDILGGLRVKESLGDDATTVFVRPSSVDELRRRLERRGDTNSEDVAVRMERVRMEMEMGCRCEYTVVNDDLEAAVDDLERIILQKFPHLGRPGDAGPGAALSRSRVRLLVSGRVQGVGYRYAAQEEAVRLGLSGWVRNLPDGRVEAVAEGEAQAVSAFVAWCHRGPGAARVAAVDVSHEEPQGERGFTIR